MIWNPFFVILKTACLGSAVLLCSAHTSPAQVLEDRSSDEENPVTLADATALPRVVVIATRTAHHASQVAASTTVFDAENPDNVFSLATSMRDYQRYEPGISIPYSGGGNGPGQNSRRRRKRLGIRKHLPLRYI